MRKQKMFPKRSCQAIVLLLVWLGVYLSACEEFVQIDPPKNELVTETVFASDAIALAAMRGVYTEMAGFSPFSGGQGSVQHLGGLSADEIYYRFSGDYLDIGENSIAPENGPVFTSWSNLYRTTYQANSLIEGLQQSNQVTVALKTQLVAEAKFIRAFCLFYLVNQWGDVPIITGTDYRVNRVLGRSAREDVYDQLVVDLTEAKANLPVDYTAGGGERVRATRWAAMALLARVHLYRGNWAEAESESSAVIEHTGLFSLVNLNEAFLKNNAEAILQFFATIPTQDTYVGELFLPPSAAATSLTLFPLREEMYTVFEAGDLRYSEWIRSKIVSGVTYYYPYKYRVFRIHSGTVHAEYYVALRLSEQYLIRAEARAHQNKLTGVASAEEDVNIIRDRAGLPATTATTQEELLSAIMQERRVELFTEGHRWFDLIRTGQADLMLAPLKPDWAPEDKRFPVPQRELNSNPMLTQNPGY